MASQLSQLSEIEAGGDEEDPCRVGLPCDTRAAVAQDPGAAVAVLARRPPAALAVIDDALADFDQTQGVGLSESIGESPAPLHHPLCPVESARPYDVRGVRCLDGQSDRDAGWR